MVGIKVGGSRKPRGYFERAAPGVDSNLLDREHRTHGALYVGGNTSASRARNTWTARCTSSCGCRSRCGSVPRSSCFHGNGQTGAVWQQTARRRPGWAYYLIDQGYVVYMVDYPARGRSAVRAER